MADAAEDAGKEYPEVRDPALRCSASLDCHVTRLTPPQFPGEKLSKRRAAATLQAVLQRRLPGLAHTPCRL